MIKTIFMVTSIILSSVAIIIVMFFADKIHPTNQIAFVRSGVVVESYEKMTDLRKELELKLEDWQKKIDTMASDFIENVNQYNAEASRLTLDDREMREQMLGLQKENMEKYKYDLQQQINSEEEKIIKKAFEDMNGYLKHYGKEYNYDIIFGTTISGNILYGKDGIDITDDVIKGLNEYYKNLHTSSSQLNKNKFSGEK